MRILIVIATLFLGNAVAASIDDRMTLVEAIEEVRAGGIEIAYSSRLVADWMLVRETPETDDPVLGLRRALAAYQLDLEPGHDGQWLVVRAPRPQHTTTIAKAENPASDAPQYDYRPIEEIMITANRHSMYDSFGGSGQFLTGEEIRLMPHIADDAHRALHRLPGVAANDFQAPFNLRGGSSDEVKVQIDGLEIIEPFHMRTLFSPLSVIDPGIIGNAQVLSGGFTADHGNYMSGVVDISTRAPETSAVHELGVSFVSAFARSSGPIAKGRGGYFVSARRGYLDLITEQVVDKGEELKPRYSDLFGRVTYAVNATVDVSLQALLSADDVAFSDPDDGEDIGEDGSQQYIWATLEAEPWPGISSSNTVFSGRIESNEAGQQVNPPAELIYRSFDRLIEYTGIQSDWRIAINPDHALRLGARYRDMSATYDYQIDATRRSDFVNNGTPFFMLRDIRLPVEGDDFGAYAAYRFRASERWTWELGYRWDSQDYGSSDHLPQGSPRINALYTLNDRAELRFGWGEFHQAQAIQDLQIPDGNLEYYAPEQADHSVIGLNYKLRSGVDLQLDLYDKKYRNLQPQFESLLDPYEFAPESNFDRAMVDPDSGHAYGAELTLRNRGGDSLDWWLNYTWSKVNDEFDGESIPRSWDQRHALTASVSWQSEKWRFTIVGRYRSGWPRTPLIVVPISDSNGNIVAVDIDLSQRNIIDYDSYSRVDLRASRTVKLKRGSFEYYLEVFNLFDTKNQCCTSNHRLSLGSTATAAPEFDDYLPLFPSFGFVWRFGAGAGD